MQIQHNASLLPYNTFGIEVNAKILATYDNVCELVDFLHSPYNTSNHPVLHIGEGSNLLFLNDYDGIVLRTNIKEVSVLNITDSNIVVRVGAGWNMDEFIAYSLNKGWYGLENLSNIPGQVGASAVQNIGAYGVEIGDRIVAVNCVSLIDGSTKTFHHEECDYAYRYSIFKSPEYRGKYAVTSVEYKLDLIFSPQIEYAGVRQAIDAYGMDISCITAHEVRDLIIAIRSKKLPDPKITGNAGSFFMNPIVDISIYENLQSMYPDIPKYVLSEGKVKIPAAWLIEHCGWKGKALGNAGVHYSQPLVLVNLGGATGYDIKTLSDRIMADVLDKFGIYITPEVNFISSSSSLI